mmetsp:Transcript_60938/g.193300  ORF Transcript_60938/g.193300 Transcript_60938/m.193300 type:complete len:251 (+) Transcript_60938:131-883(+)
MHRRRWPRCGEKTLRPPWGCAPSVWWHTTQPRGASRMSSQPRAARRSWRPSRNWTRSGSLRRSTAGWQPCPLGTGMVRRQWSSLPSSLSRSSKSWRIRTRFWTTPRCTAPSQGRWCGRWPRVTSTWTAEGGTLGCTRCLPTPTARRGRLLRASPTSSAPSEAPRTSTPWRGCWTAGWRLWVARGTTLELERGQGRQAPGGGPRLPTPATSSGSGSDASSPSSKTRPCNGCSSSTRAWSPSSSTRWERAAQ